MPPVPLADDVVFTKGAYDAFVNGTASSSERKATIVEPAANDAAAEDTTDESTEEESA